MDVLSLFANPTVRDISAIAILTLGILMILTGRLIPKSTHDRELATANKRGDEWKETALDTRTLNAELARQNSTLVESTKTPAEFFGTVMREGGGKNVAQTPGT